MLREPKKKQNQIWCAKKSSAYEIEILRSLDPVFLEGYHPTLKLSGIPSFIFIVNPTHRMDNI